MSDIVGLSAALFAEDAGNRDVFTNVNWPIEEGEGYFTDLIGGDCSFCLVAELAGGVIGYLAARVGEAIPIRPIVVAELESIYVHRPHRSVGVGEGLVREFLRLAGERGAQRTSITAYTSNERAIAFYEKISFTPKSLSMEREVR